MGLGVDGINTWTVDASLLFASMFKYNKLQFLIY